MDSKTQALIEAARQRTQALLAEQAKTKAAASKPNVTDALPTSISLQPKATNLAEANTPLVLAERYGFDPFNIEGVGRANEQQAQAIKLFGLEGKSGCLIGPAGTGKTTTMRATINAAILSGRIPILSESIAHKYLSGGVPGIYGGSFTRIATRNLRNNFPADLQCNVHTIHRLLEFEPEMITVFDEVKKTDKVIRIFKPTRHKFRTLPSQLKCFFLDETSMIGVRLHGYLEDAIHPQAQAQIVYIGDIAQIPPVMDDAILGYKMLEFIPQGLLVELTQVYRHAGAIVHLANKIRVGKTIPNSEDIADHDNKKQYPDERYMLPYHANPRKLPFKYTAHAFKRDGWQQIGDKDFRKEEDGSLVTIKFWKNRLDGEVGQLRALQNLGVYEPATEEKPAQLGFFIREIEAGSYNPLTDMILIPYNKSVGTLELNKYIANYLGRMRKAEVHEVIAGYQKHYLAIGDKVFYEREEAIITKIVHNAMYAGKLPQPAAVTLNRWGHNEAGQATSKDANGNVDDLELMLSINISDNEEERKNQASHIISVRKLIDHKEGEVQDPEDDDTIQTAAEINSIIGGYALTIHKSQGSQWPKVYCVFHNSHNRNLQRELLYTAITRAQKELYIIAEPETFIQGVLSQHIVGNTLAEKAEYFKGKVIENAKRKDLFEKG